MKRQNGVVLSGKLRDLRAEQVQVGDVASSAALATLVTDHLAYGGHHQVIFPEEHALEVAGVRGAHRRRVGGDG